MFKLFLGDFNAAAIDYLSLAKIGRHSNSPRNMTSAVAFHITLHLRVLRPAIPRITGGGWDTSSRHRRETSRPLTGSERASSTTLPNPSHLDAFSASLGLHLTDRVDL